MILYQLSTKLYFLLINIFSLFNHKAKLWVNGRKNLFPQLQEAFSKHSGPLAWVHAASLGEFEQARPVIEKIKEEYPHYKILLTFFSPSGYEIRKNYEGADYIFYLPADSKDNATQFISITKPDIVFFVKYEFWYHYLKTLSDQQIPIILFSSIFRKEQLFFQWYGRFYLNMLKYFNHLFVQNQSSALLLKNHHIPNVSVTGDTRFDRVASICKKVKDIPVIKQFKDKSPLLIIGSSWNDDIKVLAPAINQLSQPLKYVIAPHEISEENILFIEKSFQKKCIRYSKAIGQSIPINQYDILIIDNIGMLSSIYQYGTFAYIGGGFGKGIHNILEAVTFGMPIFFGPQYKKFQEALDLIALKSAFSIHNTEDFFSKFTLLYNDEKLRNIIIEKNKEYITSNTGSSSKIIHHCQQYFHES